MQHAEVSSRNPDIVVAVLWEHGYWGYNSAKVAAEVINTFVNKQRKRAGNVRLEQASNPAPAAGTGAEQAPVKPTAQDEGSPAASTTPLEHKEHPAG